MTGQNPNPLTDPKMQEAAIDDTMQAELNKPLTDPTGISAEDMSFLTEVMAKVDTGDINLLVIDTLINHEVYDKLDEVSQGRIDIEAHNILSTLRQIRTLWDLKETDSFQIQNLVHQLRISKERFEGKEGDVFII